MLVGLKRWRSTALALAVVSSLIGTGETAWAAGFCDSPKTSDQGSMQRLVDGQNAFAISLYQTVRTQKGNLFFSPYSISTALDMTYGGARGETARQMAAAMHLSLEQSAVASTSRDFLQTLNCRPSVAYSLESANALWVQNGYQINDAFSSELKSDYDAKVSNVDFAGQTEAARGEINQWVADKTNQKITDLIPQGLLDNYTRLVLTNAVHYKGAWVSPFSPEGTSQDSFWLNATESTTVPTMHNQDKYAYVSDSTLQAISLPFIAKDRTDLTDQSLIVVLPRQRDGLDALETNFGSQKLTALLDKMSTKTVTVSLPKFKLSSTLDLKNALEALGMKDAFDADRADFTGIVSGDRLHVDDVLHKAFIDVNEKGAEAAAATAVIISESSVEIGEPEVFNADHPFLFFIRDNPTGAILFAGRVVDPR